MTSVEHRPQLEGRVSRVVRLFWETVAMAMFCTGIGIALTCGALWDAGILPLVFAAVGAFGGLVLAYISEGYRRRYLRWVPPSG